MSDITVINDSEQSSLVTNGLAKNGELYLKAAGSTNAGAIVVYDNGVWRTFANDFVSGYNLDASYNISTTPVTHFDASILDGSNSGNNPSDGTSISSFGNRSGSATSYTATQSTAANQPVYKESGGLSYVEVVTQNWMELANGVYFGSSDDFTEIHVAKRTTNWFGTALNSSSVYSYLGGAFYNMGGSRSWLVGTDDASNINTTELDSLHILVVQRNSGTVKVWFNSGTNRGAVSNTASFTYNRLFQGSNTDALKGHYYEDLWFDSALSLSELNTVRSYLANKYSITSSNFS
jgi:hypothetical protein